MVQAVQDALKAWSAPILLSALFTVCGVLWLDQREQIKTMTEKIEQLTAQVIRLTVISDENKRN